MLERRNDIQNAIDRAIRSPSDFASGFVRPRHYLQFEMTIVVLRRLSHQSLLSCLRQSTAGPPDNEFEPK
jgi:hypothetical protein